MVVQKELNLVIKVNLKTGETLSFDLAKDTEYKDLVNKLEDNDFVKKITGMSSLYNTYWHALTIPKNFKSIRYIVSKVNCVKNGVKETVGEKIICHADNIRMAVLVYYNERPKMTRIEMKKVGKSRFVPNRGL